MKGRTIVLLAVLAGSLAGQIRSEAAQAPSFTLQPRSQTVVAGSSATFSAVATGATPLTYQWWFNGRILSGQTNTNLSLVSVTLSNSGNYSVTITNSHGGIVSSNAVLSVGYPPILVQQPVSQAAVLNSNVQFSVTASGTAPLAYQWLLNGQGVFAATNSSLFIAGMQVSNSGVYSVVVSNSYGGVTSALATLSAASPPEFLWARRVTNTVNGYTGTSYGKHVAIDESGNVFVVGYYNGWGVDFGGAVLTNSTVAATAASFVCKYDHWGNFVWVRQFSTNGFPALRVATDAGGSVYVTGDYQGFATFGTNVLFSSGGRLMFVAKYDTDGQALWARGIVANDPSGGGSGRGFTVDSAGNSFLVAAYQGTAYFDTTNVTGSAAFLARHDSDGNLTWVRGVSPATGICVGSSGAIYTCNLTLTKYDAGGNQIWSRPFASAQCLTLDNAENIYASGLGNGTYGDLTVTNVAGISDFFAAKCNSDGKLLWCRQLGSTKQQTGTGIALDCFGNVYVVSISASAQREPTLSFGSTTLTNVMNLLLNYDTFGNPVWARALGGTNRAPAAGIRVLNPGTAFVAGTFFGSAQFDSFNLASDSPTSLEDIYVGEVATPPGYSSAAATLMSPAVGAANQIQFQVSGAPGLKYAIEASTNLVDWLRLQTNVSPFLFIDSTAEDPYQRFYRSVWIP